MCVSKLETRYKPDEIDETFCGLYSLNQAVLCPFIMDLTACIYIYIVEDLEIALEIHVS